MRSLQHLFGHPDALARPHDQTKIVQGNKTMQATASLLRACLRANVPCALENPCGSRLFRVRPIAALCRHPQTTPHVCDFCQYGSLYRKRTKLMLWGCGTLKLLQSRCSGKGGLCSRTGQHHQILQGNVPGSRILMTALAEPYPVEFMRLAARCVSNKIRGV